MFSYGTLSTEQRLSPLPCDSFKLILSLAAIVSFAVPKRVPRIGGLERRPEEVLYVEAAMPATNNLLDTHWINHLCSFKGCSLLLDERNKRDSLIPGGSFVFFGLQSLLRIPANATWKVFTGAVLSLKVVVPFQPAVVEAFRRVVGERHYANVGTLTDFQNNDNEVFSWPDL